MQGRTVADLLLDYALSTGLTSRLTDESKEKSWLKEAYRYFCQRKLMWWFMKSEYNVLADGTKVIPLPLDFRAFAHPKKILVGDVFYDLIAQDEVARHTVSGSYPVALPTVARPRLCYIDESDETLNFLSAPADDTAIAMKYIRQTGRVRSGTAQGAASNTITLDSGASSQDDVYNGMKIRITAGTGSAAPGQVRTISDYVGSSKVATISENWTTTPTSASTFVIGDVLEVDNDRPSIPDEFCEALIHYMQYRRWAFLTEVEQSKYHKDEADLIIATAASEIGKKKFGSGDYLLPG